MGVAVTAAGLVCLSIFAGIVWWPAVFALWGVVGVAAGLGVDWEALTRAESADPPSR